MDGCKSGADPAKLDAELVAATLPGTAPMATPAAVADGGANVQVSKKEAVGSAWGEPLAVGSGWGDPVPKHDQVAGGVGGTNFSEQDGPTQKVVESWDHGMQLQSFLMRNYVDTAAEENLRGLSVEMQHAVMQRGPLISSDASGELFSRIRDVTSRRHEGSPDHSGDSVARFARENSIDGSAEGALRALPRDLLDKVLEEGSLHNTRNPSAVLMSRIQRARGGGDRSPGRRRSRSPSASRQRPAPVSFGGPPGGMPPPPPGGPPGGMPPPPAGCPPGIPGAMAGVLGPPGGMPPPPAGAPP